MFLNVLRIILCYKMQSTCDSIPYLLQEQNILGPLYFYTVNSSNPRHVSIMLNFLVTTCCFRDPLPIITLLTLVAFFSV